VHDLLEDFALEIGQSLLLHAAKGIEVRLGTGDEVSGAVVDIAHDRKATFVEPIKAAEDEDAICIEGFLFQFACVWVAYRFGSGAIGVEDGFSADDAIGLSGSGSVHSQGQTNGKKSTAGFHDLNENRLMLSVRAVITIPKLHTVSVCLILE
jgi:hypothetical protein